MSALSPLRRSRARVTVLAVATMFVASSAHAQSPVPNPTAAAAEPAPEHKTPEAKEAEQRFQRGRQLFDEGDYALALVEFTRAYDLSPNYRVQFNIAQINIQLFNYAAARTALEKFLRDGGQDIPAARKAQAETDLEMLKGRTAHLKISTVPPTADVALDDVPIGTAPFASPLLVNAGQRKVVVTRTGFVPITKVVTLAGGDTKDVIVELAPLADVRPEGPKLTTTTNNNYTPAAIGWVATGSFAVAATVFGALYLSKESELEDLSAPSQNVSAQTKKEAEASATRMAVAADVFGVLAVGAAAVSIYFTLRPPHTESVKVTKIRFTPVGVAGTF